MFRHEADTAPLPPSLPLAPALRHVVGTSAVVKICNTTLVWWRGLAHYWLRGGLYEDFPLHTGEDEASIESRVYVRSIALAMAMWSLPHYRNGTFREDMEKNLRNVAVPGTGIPLSVFCRGKLRFYFAVLVLAPLACLFAAAFVPDAVRDESAKTKGKASGIAARFEELLLHPKDWFTLWRINCVLASYNALVTKSDDFKMEDKWTFLQDAEKKGIPVSPTLDFPAIVVKDRNEEGGMGLHFYANAKHNGRWIIQKVLHNAPFIADMLPANAPLSTIRIVTASAIGLPGSSGSSGADTVSASVDSIEPLSAVLRLGREGALTDHDAILFDADLATGTIREGTINKQWYKLGLENVTLSLPALTHPPAGPQRFTSHPDSGVSVTGKRIPDISGICDLVKRAHFECCPTVPLCGWDVSLSDEGTVLLEVNLSCNFFQATIDRDRYFRFVDKHFTALERNTPILA